MYITLDISVARYANRLQASDSEISAAHAVQFKIINPSKFFCTNEPPCKSLLSTLFLLCHFGFIIFTFLVDHRMLKIIHNTRRFEHIIKPTSNYTRHTYHLDFFKVIDNNDDEPIIEKFELVNFRDEFEYAFKMFWRATDAVMPKKEAELYINDFKDEGKIRRMIRTYYEGGGQTLRADGKKVQVLIDDYIRSLNISELMNPKEITYDNFLSYAAKFKSERAKIALIKNKARQIIRELAPNNPVYYEKLRERLDDGLFRREWIYTDLPRSGK